jgi:ATP-dependent DNA helicase PIF1
MTQVINVTLRRSYLWNNMRHLKLVCNMRAQSNQWFLEFLLGIENNVEQTLEEDYIKLPSEICVPYT